MGIVFVIAIAILGVILYKMLGSSEKTYAYSRTMVITYRADGSEQLTRSEENGIIFLTKKNVTIDGTVYLYKSPDRKKIQARLNYDGGHLKSITLAMRGGGEKFYYVDRINSVKDIQRR